MFPPRSPPGRDIDSDSFYLVEHTMNTASTSSSFGHIHQPQPIRAVPSSLVWGTDPHTLARQEDYREEQSGATYFPGPENSLGLFSTDPKFSAVTGSPSGFPHLQPFPPAPLEIEDYDIEGGWSFDVTGRAHYVPHGGIKEFGDDDEHEHMHVSPAEGVYPLAEDSRTFLNEEPLPPETTPPPRPKQRPVELVPLHILGRLPLGDGSNTYLGPPSPSSPIQYHDFSGSHDYNDHSATPRTCSSPTILTQSQELRTIEENLVSLMTGSLDILFLHATFAAVPVPLDADLQLCDQVGDALHAVETSLKRRSEISPEEWRLRSISCQRKYDYRLLSLQKTLRRLHVLSSRPPRVSHLEKIRVLLRQHHAKLSDLAAKFNATFDRLRVRHFTHLLSDVYNDIQRGVAERKEERKTARAARWPGPYDHAFHREGRRPSIVEVS
ncbi:hypothetical protein DFH07DRAFT_551528 [Mycena maculata]|uniref:Uncharacterized protein n=1 Tax=Mycena maculata TaxID=230809 RepID=A0AAD7N7J9_9AGAR|nr:hypothetical protein DFH07DRAFT_551528 [Mycena maculata]